MPYTTLERKNLRTKKRLPKMAQRKRYDANANVIGTAVGCTDLAAFTKADLRALVPIGPRAGGACGRGDQRTETFVPVVFAASARPGVVAASRGRSGAARIVGVARRGRAALPTRGTKPEAPAGA